MTDHRLEPFSDVLVQHIATQSGIAPLIILVHAGTASLTRLGALPADAPDEAYDEAVARHLNRLEALTLQQRLEYHRRVDVTVDAPFLADVLVEQSPEDAAIAERMAATDFGDRLAAEGHPVVAMDEDGQIREYDPAELTSHPPQVDVLLADKALEAAAARHAAASLGPWTRARDVIIDGHGQPVALTGFAAFPARDVQPWHRRDADFIAHAWEDVRGLLAEVRRLRSRLAASQPGTATSRRRVHHRVTKEELAAVREELARLEERYGYPTERASEVPEFQLPDGGGADCDNPVLVRWMGLDARYSAMLAADGESE